MDSGFPDTYDASQSSDHLVRRNGQSYAGIHLIIDVRGGSGLDDEPRVRQAVCDCITACGATLLHLHTHQFSPQGITGVAVLAESHIALHTWPEHGYAAFDMFLCRDFDLGAPLAVLRHAFATENVTSRELLRGKDIANDTH